MANRYQRKDVLEALHGKALGVCSNVFTTSRPTATDQMDSFVVVRLPNGIRPYADTHNTAFAQFVCYVRDRQGGVENVNVEEEMVDGLCALFPFSDDLLTCVNAPIVLESKSDGMGFHAVVMQFRIVIKF